MSIEGLLKSRDKKPPEGASCQAFQLALAEAPKDCHELVIHQWPPLHRQIPPLKDVGAASGYIGLDPQSAVAAHFCHRMLLILHKNKLDFLAFTYPGGARHSLKSGLDWESLEKHVLPLSQQFSIYDSFRKLVPALKPMIQPDLIHFIGEGELQLVVIEGTPTKPQTFYERLSGLELEIDMVCYLERASGGCQLILAQACEARAGGRLIFLMALKEALSEIESQPISSVS